MSNQVERTADGLRITRLFRAPRELVFQAWTDVDRVQSWWGCAQTTAVDSTIDLREGGTYRHVMQIEGVGEVDMTGTFTVVDPPSKIEYTMANEPIPGFPPPSAPEMTTTVEFHDRGEETEVVLTLTGIAAEQLKDIVTQGWEASFAKLAADVEPQEQVAG